ESSIFATELLRTNKEIGPRCLTAFSLNRFNYESRHIARMQFSIQGLDIIKRHTRIKPLHERAKTFRETFATHQGQGTQTQPVKCACQRHRAFAASCSAGKLERTLHRFRTGV